MNRILVASLAVMLAGFVIGVSFGPIYSGDDTYQSLSHLDTWVKAFESSDFLPTWTPGDANGYGSPLPFFYHKAFNFIAAAFSIILENQVYGFRAGVLFFSIAMFVGMYFLSGQLLAQDVESRSDITRTRLVIATAFLFSPYALTNLVARTAVAEFSAMAIVSFVIAFALSIVNTQRRMIAKSWGLIGCFMLLGLAHITIFLATIAVIVSGAIFYLKGSTRSGAAAVIFSACFSLGLFLVLVYVPFVYWGKLFSPQQALIWGRPAANTVSLLQLVSPLPHSRFAWISVALIGLLFFQSRRLNSRKDYLTLGLGLFALLLMVCMTKISNPLWRASSQFDFVQFPWRLLAVSTPLVFAAFAGATGLMTAKVRPRFEALLILVTIVQSLYFMTSVARHYTVIPENQIVHSPQLMASWNPDAGGEYFPARYAEGLASMNVLTAKPNTVLPPPQKFVRTDGACDVDDIIEPDQISMLRFKVACHGSGVVHIAQFQTPFLDASVVRSDGTLSSGIASDAMLNFPLTSGVWQVSIRERGYLELVLMAWSRPRTEHAAEKIVSRLKATP